MRRMVCVKLHAITWKQEFRMATMLDVSLRAGVSKATVSRVLNGTGQVKESTRQQVFAAMEELGYRPNFLARSLANQTNAPSTDFTSAAGCSRPPDKQKRTVNS
jgi:hypothetical protein